MLRFSLFFLSLPWDQRTVMFIPAYLRDCHARKQRNNTQPSPSGIFEISLIRNTLELQFFPFVSLKKNKLLQTHKWFVVSKKIFLPKNDILDTGFAIQFRDYSVTTVTGLNWPAVIILVNALNHSHHVRKRSFPKCRRSRRSFSGVSHFIGTVLWDSHRSNSLHLTGCELSKEKKEYKWDSEDEELSQADIEQKLVLSQVRMENYL